MGNKNGIDDLLKKLKTFDNRLAREIAPSVDKLFKESVTFSVIDFYNSYNPQIYERTNNFLNIAEHTKTVCSGNKITMTASSEYMHPYPGFWKQQLNAESAFDMFFMHGEHGHGKWLMHTSVPPFMQVDNDIDSGFDGRIMSIMNNSIRKILK